MARPTLPLPVLAKEGNQMMGKKRMRRRSDKNTVRVRVCRAGDDGGGCRRSRLKKKKNTWGSWVDLERKTNMTCLFTVPCKQVGEEHEKLKSDKHFLIKITSSCWMVNATLTQNQAIQSKESC